MNKLTNLKILKTITSFHYIVNLTLTVIIKGNISKIISFGSITIVFVSKKSLNKDLITIFVICYITFIL